jgi:hypothetical protein
MRTFRWLVLVSPSVLLLPCAARAAAPTDPSLYIQPQTGVSLRIEGKEQRGVVRFSLKDRSGFAIDTTFSAPLDDNGEAAWGTTAGLSPGVGARVAIGYDSLTPHLDLTSLQADIATQRGACIAISGLKTCTATEAALETWYTRYFDANRPRQSFACELATKPDETPDQKSTRELRVADCKAAEAYFNDHTPCPVVDRPQNACDGAARGLAYFEQKYAARKTATARADLDLSRFAIPSGPTAGSRLFYALLFEASGSFDKASVYSAADISAAPTSESNYTLALGPRFDLYYAPGWAFSAAAGWELARELSVAPVQRCTAIATEDEAVTGKSCSDVKVLREPAESASSAFGRLSAMYLARNVIGKAKDEKAVPGMEGRLQVTGIGQKEELQARFTAFLLPAVGPALSRFGVGVDLSFPLRNDADNGVKAGKLHDVAPFFLIGASL